MLGLLLAMGMASMAQNAQYFKQVMGELTSAKYQGRGYARGGVNKAGKYLAREFQHLGADTVAMQPMYIDINTFPGKMKLWADGREVVPGQDFVMREYSPGVKGTFKLYYLDTANYDIEKIISDLNLEENRNAFVVCDFWFIYRHPKDFHRLESRDGAPNAGMAYVWDTPLKFYKAYGEKVVDKPVIWLSPTFPKDAKYITANIENRFMPHFESNNVIARIEGECHDSCYMFTAHYDHLGNMGRNLFFPGANDNASGVAAILTLAQYYASHKPRFDMVFVAFTGEEANLRGSSFYAEHPMVPLNKVKYLFNLDMIGDNNPNQYFEVSPEGEAGVRLMEQINSQQHLFKSLKRGDLAGNSDHWPFAEKKVPCILFENEEGDSFPYYHTALDDMEHVRYDTYEPLFKLITTFISRY